MARDPMKVLHLIKALGRGGAEVLLAEGLAVADRERFEYSYGYIQSYPDDVVESLRAQGVRVDCFHLNGNLQMLLGARRVARYLREHGIDLVHAHLPMAGIVARLAGRMANVPVVYTEHGTPHQYHPALKRLHRLTWQWQEQVVAISDDVSESIHDHIGRRVPVETVWNGVNTSVFKPTHHQEYKVRDALGIPPDAPLVGTVAVFRDTPQKRLDVWLDAARLISDEIPGTHFLMVGDGLLRSKLEAQVAALGLVEVVHFAGRQVDVRPYLAAMDLFLMSSAYEGFGIAPVEAMAMEVAVVATNVEGIRNVVSNGETGLLGAFDENAAQTLARLVVELIQHPERRRRLAVAGRRSAVEKFSIERMQRELEAIYDRVVTRQHRQVISPHGN